MHTILAILFVIIFGWWLLGVFSRKESKGPPVPYICIRCEQMFAAPDNPSKCPTCNGDVVPYLS